MVPKSQSSMLMDFFLLMHVPGDREEQPLEALAERHVTEELRELQLVPELRKVGDVEPELLP